MNEAASFYKKFRVFRYFRVFRSFSLLLGLPLHSIETVIKSLRVFFSSTFTEFPLRRRLL
jgi:hypothetical protein